MIVLFSCLTMSPPLVYRSTIYCSFMNSRFCWVLYMLFLSHLDRFCATISLRVEDFLSMTDNQESDFSQIFRVTPKEDIRRNTPRQVVILLVCQSYHMMHFQRNSLLTVHFICMKYKSKIKIS